MFERALIATDLGEPAEQFIRCKQGLRHLGVQEIVLGFCMPLHEVRDVRANIQDILKPELARRRDALERQGYSVTVELVLGEPSIEVNRLADAKDCDLVVVGSRVHSLAGEVVLGGVAGEVLHSCRKPLLVARIPEEAPEAQVCPLASLNRVLFATDFSENADHAFEAVVELVSERRTSVVLMHVQDRTTIDRHLKDRLEKFNAIDQERLERLKDHLLSKGAKDVQVELPFGLPTEEILRCTRQGDVSLVVMGSQGRGFFSEILLGSVSHNIARHAFVPTLLVPALPQSR